MSKSKTKSELILELETYIHKNKKIPKKHEFKNINGLSSRSTYRKVFEDSFLKILEQCKYDKENIKINSVKYYEQNFINRSKEEVIKTIYDMQSKIDRPLMYNDFRNPSINEVGITCIIKFFGTMNKMKEELGLEIIQESMIDKMKSKEELLLDMKNYINKLGQLPKLKEIDKNKEIANGSTYCNYFGGINKVFLLLGYMPNKKVISHYLSNEEIIQIYKDFVKNYNYTPPYEYCKGIYELPSPRTVLRRLNCTWNEFMVQIGCNINSNSRGNITYAKDGTMCLSNSEAMIHDYFLENKIEILKKEFLYRSICDESQLDLKELIGYKRSDWIIKINNKLYIVEYFGMCGIYDYDKRHDIKLEFIKRMNLESNFIALYPKDLSKINSIFSNIKNYNVKGGYKDGKSNKDKILYRRKT